MSLDEARNPPAHWKAFLPRPTADVDYIAAMPSTAVAGLETIAGRGSALHVYGYLLGRTDETGQGSAW